VAQVGRPFRRGGGGGGAAQRVVQFLPTIGYDNRDGLFLQESATVLRRRNLSATLNATLGTGRGLRGSLETETHGPLRVVSALSYREDAPNQRARFLEYSRLPEVGIIYSGATGEGTAPPGGSHFLPTQIGQMNVRSTPETRDQWRYAVEMTGGFFSQRRGRSTLPDNVDVDGGRFLLQGQVARPAVRVAGVRFQSLRLLAREALYDTGDSYTVVGAGIGKGWKLGPLSVGVERLSQYTLGSTPFLFDRVEIRNEWRPRAELKSGGWNLSWIGRFDEGQGEFFDNLFAISKRTQCLQPRLGYSTRRNEITFDLRLLGVEPAYGEAAPARGMMGEPGGTEGMPGSRGRRR
jgi:hypothetical protein